MSSYIDHSHRKRIIFIGRNPLLGPVIERLAQKHVVTNMHKHTSPLPPWRNVQAYPVTYFTFGLEWLVKKFHIQISLPASIKGLSHHLRSLRPEQIIVLDFYRLYFWQLLRYKYRHPECKIYLYSETKAFPKNPITRLFMHIFLYFLKQRLSLLDAIFVYTEQGVAFFRHHAPDARIVLAPAAIASEMFYPDPNKEYMPDGVIRILMNARFVRFKRHTDLFKALMIVKERGIPFKLSLVSRGGDDVHRLRYEINAHGLTEQVELLPPVPHEHMREYYTAHDVLVLPSLNEAVGMVVPEAMACGVPTITSDTVGANVYVQESETGLIFETMDVEDLARCIACMANAQMLQKYGSAAQRRIETYFTPTKISDEFMAALGLGKKSEV